MEREIGHLLDELKSKNFFKDEFMKNLSLKFKKN